MFKCPQKEQLCQPQLVTLNITVCLLLFFIVLHVLGGSQRPRCVPKCGGASWHRRVASVRSGGPQRLVNVCVGAGDVWN